MQRAVHRHSVCEAHSQLTGSPSRSLAVLKGPRSSASPQLARITSACWPVGGNGADGLSLTRSKRRGLFSLKEVPFWPGRAVPRKCTSLASTSTLLLGSCGDPDARRGLLSGALYISYYTFAAGGSRLPEKRPGLPSGLSCPPVPTALLGEREMWRAEKARAVRN